MKERDSKEAPGFSDESGFWETLAGMLKQAGSRDLPPLFQSLSRRSAQLNLPVGFGGAKSEGWALVCRLLLAYHNHTPPLGRREFLALKAGTKRAVNARFTSAAFRRAAANIAWPSTPGRSIADSLADTFLVNGLSTIGGYGGRGDDSDIITALLGDDEAMNLARVITEPPEGMWQEAGTHYRSNRPGFVKRTVQDLHSLMFSR